MAHFSNYFWHPFFWYFSVAALLSMAVLATFRFDFGKRWLFGLLFGLSLLLWGYTRASHHQELNHTDHWVQQLTNDSIFKGVMQIDNIRIGNERMRLELSARQHQSGAVVSGHAYLSIPLDTITKAFKAYDKIYIEAKASRLKAAANPHAFDFSAYLAGKNIHYQLRTESGAYYRIGASSFSLPAFAEKWRSWALSRLRSGISRPREMGVAAALILGHRDELDLDIKSAYAETGAIHVLAVSGLHVGIMAQMVGWFLLLLPSKKNGIRLIRLAILLSFIWGFALMTGLSPSVSRAAMMFSLLALGDFARGRHNIYNTLFASALILLLYNPLWLWDIGFQLSYLAVLGIVYFQPIFYRAIYPPQRVLRWVWALLSVALAAQLTTFPLSLYYFHQFPLYFWLSGLVVPLVGPILALGVVFIFLAKIPLLNSLLAYALSGLLFITNSFIYWIHRLPGGLWAGHWLDAFALVCLFTMIVAIGAYLRIRRAGYLLFGLGACSLFLLQIVLQQDRQLHQQEIVVYQLYRASLIDFFRGDKLYSLSSLSAEAKAIAYAADNHRLSRGLIEPTSMVSLGDTLQTEDIWYDGTFGQFADFTFAIIHDRSHFPTQAIEVDLLVITQNADPQAAEWQALIVAKQVVIDGSNAPWRVADWSLSCKDQLQNCYSTSQSGAFRYSPSKIQSLVPTF